MKPKPTLQIKRQPASGFRALRAVTSKTKSKKSRAQRAATTADPEDIGEVPGVGVARALVVILLLHIAAIGGIFVHNKWTNSEDQKAIRSEGTLKTPVGPVLIPGVEHYLVVDGDNYFKIAEKKGVSVADLKRLNQNVNISPGIQINLPRSRGEVLPISPDPRDGGVASLLPPVAVEDDPSYTHNEHPPIQVSNEQTLPGQGASGAFEEVYNAPREVDRPKLITPKPRPAHVRPAPPVVQRTKPAPPVHREPATPAPQRGRVHVISKGDTVWGISKRYGVSASELKRLNGIGF